MEIKAKNKIRTIGSRMLIILKAPDTFSISKKTAILVLFIASLTLICIGAVYSSKYADKADSLWYQSVRNQVSSSMVIATPKSSKTKVDNKELEKNILKKMSKPESIPSPAKNNQRKANIYGAVGILGLFLLLSLIIYYFGSKRKSALRAPVS